MTDLLCRLASSLLLSVGTAAFVCAQAQPQLISTRIRFTDVTASAGIDFVHSGGSGAQYRYAEHFGSGAAFLDYNGDGWLDLFLAQGAALPGFTGPDPSGNRLYRNDANGRFSDVTAVAGLTNKRFTFAIAVGDADNDGDPDLVLTTLSGAQLYRNDRGRFVETTENSGLEVEGLALGASFLDFDRDGWLDVFISRYAPYELAEDAGCPAFSKAGNPEPSSDMGVSRGRKICVPGDLKPASNLLFRNTGNGRFADVSTTAGVSSATGHGLGVAVADYNEDGWSDVFVASDMLPNLLFINERNGSFVERALAAGVAVGAEGRPYAGMGTDTADYDNDGHMDLFITNYANETSSLYRGTGDGSFTDESRRSGIAALSLAFLKWGCRFQDFDHDGRADLFVVNGHLDQREADYAQRAQVYANADGRRFREVGLAAGPFFRERHVSRSAAFADYDNDGDMDAVITNNKQAAVLLRNDTPPAARWIRLALKGERLNLDALGAVARVTSGGITQTQTVKSGGSYLSDHDRRLLFALPGADAPDVEIRWPCGAVQKVSPTPGATTTVKEQGCRLTKRPRNR